MPLWDERQTARASNRTTARDAWNYIKDRSVVRYFEAFLQSHPDSEFAPLARSRLAALGGRPRSARDAWNYIKDRSVVRYFEAFLQSHPDSEFAPLARSRLAALGGRQTNTEARPRTARDAWDFIKDRSVVRFFEDFLQAYPNSGLAPLARSRLAALRGETVVLAADTTAPVIDTPLRIDTDQAVIDVAGRVADESDVVELTLNRRAIALGSGNRFRVQRAVPVGTSELRIAALDEWGNRAEKRVVINRTAAAAQPEEAPPPAIEVDPMDEEYVALRNANVRAAPSTDSQKLTTLGAGTAVTVTGKVRGAEWYRIERGGGGEGYVFASLLAEAPRATEAPSQAVQEVALTPDIDFGRYHALVIGINAYKNLPVLETAVNDASAVADLLRQKYGFKVTLLLNPGRSDVIRALDKLRGDLTPRDNLLIYYAGHGVLDEAADAGFWMSVDAEEGTRADWISIGAVTQTVRAMSAKHVMVVSDSCYSGRFTRGLSVSVKTGSERVAELKRLAGKRSRTALVSGGLEPVADGGGDRPFRVHPRLPDGTARERASSGRPAAVHRGPPPGDRERRSDARILRYPPRRPRWRRLPVRAG